MLTISLASSLLGCGSMSTYSHGTPTVHRYRMEVLQILEDPDPDGDGVVDNHLPSALSGVAAALPEQGLDLEQLNLRMAETIALRTPLFVEAAVSGDELVLTVANGQFDASGAAGMPPLIGVLDPTGAFWAGPGDVVVEVAVHEAFAPVPFELLETFTEGSIDQLEIVGTISTLIPVESIIANVIEPTVPAEGWDLDWDGEPESRSEVMALVEELAPLAADTELADGSPAISAVLTFAALAE
jgi:hypothetical protein